MATKKRERFVSPKGTAVWPRLNEPDTKFKPEGEYTVSLAFDPNDKDFKALIRDGRIRRVGVDCFDAGSVECQAAYHWQAADFSSWMDEIERFVERGDVKCYAENAFNAVSGEIPLYPLECGGRLCAEIDNQADREVVLTRFRQEVL